MVYRRNDGTKNIYYRNPVPYVNEFNEDYIVNVALCKIDVGTTTIIDISKTLPQQKAGAIVTSVALASNVILYKDARERLTFTIKLN